MAKDVNAAYTKFAATIDPLNGGDTATTLRAVSDEIRMNLSSGISYSAKANNISQQMQNLAGDGMTKAGICAFMELVLPGITKQGNIPTNIHNAAWANVTSDLTTALQANKMQFNDELCTVSL